jgi:four helix bundle protein
MKSDKGYKKLRVWEKANELVVKVYQETVNFPKEEGYGITSQLRRAAVSVPTNIVEGMGRQSSAEIRRFSGIALGSLAEVEYLLELCFSLGYFSSNQFEKLESIRDEVGGMLWNFYKSLK